MLAALIIWFGLAILLYLYGQAATAVLARRLGEAPVAPIGLTLTLLLGLVVFVTLTATLSLIMALSALAVALLVVGAVIAAVVVRPPMPILWHWPVRSEWLSWGALLLVGLIVLESATHAPSNPDTNLYHAQMIRWAESFRVVPGLGNLDARFAFNSDWLLLNAVTSLAFLQLRSFHLAAGLLFLIACGYFGGGLFKLRTRPALLSNWLRVIFLYMAFRLLVDETSSPGTDLPVNLLTWMLVALLAEYLEAEVAATSKAASVRLLVIGILPAFIVTLKLSAAPLTLVSIYAFIVLLHRWEPRAAWIQAAFMLLIVLPWLVRSLVLSGYLVFPYVGLNLFAFDWKVPTTYVLDVRNAVVGWARLPNKDWAPVVALPLQRWLPAWFAGQTLTQRLMIIAALLSPLALLLERMRRYGVIVALNYVAILFWLLSAPNLRFGYGPLVVGIALLAGGILSSLAPPLRPALSPALSTATAAVLLVLLSSTFISTFDAGSLRQRLLLPMDYQVFRTEACAVGNLEFRCASAYRQCGYEAFPCVPQVRKGVQPRGSSLQDGFRSTP